VRRFGLAGAIIAATLVWTAPASAGGLPLLTVGWDGVNNTDTITSDDGRINCPAESCAAAYKTPDVVTLTATPGAGHIFTGWTGDCTGTGTCTVTMDAGHTVAAHFVSGSRGVDLLIGRSTDDVLLGDGIHNDDAQDQTRGWSAVPGESRTFVIDIQNEGTVNDKYDIEGCGPSDGVRVRYLLGSSDATDILLGGGLALGPPPGESNRLRLRMTPTADAIPGTVKKCKVSATSQGDPSLVDAVKAKLRVKAP
jgi:uncharacterized repeat protein (TIGR02543 family)